ncbi:MAG: hypothetical protein Q9210_007243, partial [Variospora velana]
MAGLIAMTSVLVVVAIEMFFAIRGAGHSHSSEYGAVPGSEGAQKHNRSNSHLRPAAQRSQSMRPFRQGDIGGGFQPDGMSLISPRHSTERLINSKPPSLSLQDTARSIRRSSFHDHDPEANNDSDLDLDDLEPPSSHNHSHHNQTTTHSTHSTLSIPPTSSPPTPANPQKLLLQCLLLEAGILFHSIFIGLALSLAVGTSFIVLLVAISFHQTFEGLALGSRIAALPFPLGSPKPWLMALAYGATTPIGQAIGLAVHGLYDQQGQGGLLMVGITNA